MRRYCLQNGCLRVDCPPSRFILAGHGVGLAAALGIVVTGRIRALIRCPMRTALSAMAGPSQAVAGRAKTIRCRAEA